MNVRHMPFFAAIHRRIDWLEQRQTVLAQNVANADTPDYRPRDVKPLKFDALVAEAKPGLKLAATSGTHMDGTMPPTSPIRSNKQRRVFETAPAGNAVVLEEQLAKVDRTELAHKLANTLYRKHLGFFRIAIGGR